MIVLSCGHKVDDFDHAHNVIIKTNDREGEKALGYMVVCGPCEDRYRQGGYLFDDEDTATEWMFKKEW